MNKKITTEYVALFIDGDNISYKNCSKIINTAKKYGKILISRVYGDFSKDDLKLWETPSITYSIEPILVWRLSEKNSSDIRLTADAIEIANDKPYINKYIIVSGDKDYTTLINKLKIRGNYIIGISKNILNTSILLKNCCDEFIILDNIKSIEEENIICNLNILKKTIIKLIENENNNFIQISQLKEKLLQLDSSFTETNYGFDSFSKLLKNIDKLIIKQIDTTLYVSL